MDFPFQVFRNREGSRYIFVCGRTHNVSGEGSGLGLVFPLQSSGRCCVAVVSCYLNARPFRSLRSMTVLTEQERKPRNLPR